jgi:hypothetical protein
MKCWDMPAFKRGRRGRLPAPGFGGKKNGHLYLLLYVFFHTKSLEVLTRQFLLFLEPLLIETHANRSPLTRIVPR